MKPISMNPSTRRWFPATIASLLIAATLALPADHLVFLRGAALGAFAAERPAAQTPPAASAVSPAAPASATPLVSSGRASKPEPGRFEPYTEYLDRHNQVSPNLRIYLPNVGKNAAVYDTVRALQEQRERHRRAMQILFGQPRLQAETVYNPPPGGAAAPTTGSSNVTAPPAPMQKKESAH